MNSPNHSKEPEIKFKPINEGLGFHPFSDGLPYASQNQTQLKSKAISKDDYSKKQLPPKTQTLNPYPFTANSGGAWAAGSPTFVNPNSPLTQTQKNLINQSLKNLPKSFTSEIEAKKSPLEETQLGEHFGAGYLFSRLAAYIVDSTFNLTLSATILSFALIRTDLEVLRESSEVSLILSGIFLYLCNWAAITGQEIAFGSSLGKKVFGLKLKGTGSDVFIRAVSFIPSQLFFGFGILACLFDEKNRGWHDRFSRSQPEY